MALKIDHQLCTSCGACVDACPFGALDLVDDKPQVNDACTLCGTCVDTCPVEAISLEVAAKAADGRAAQARGVWVYAEQRRGEMPEVVAELLGQGRRLAETLGVELSAVLLGHQVEPLVTELFAWGADRVYLCDDPRLLDFNDDLYGQALGQAITDHHPEILLAGATALGRSLIPRVATEVSTGLTADCTGLEIDPEKRLLLQTRPAFGGNIMATIVCPEARPQMATVRPRVMKKGAYQAGRAGELVRFALAADAISSTEVLETVCALDDCVDLTGAEIIVCGGRGLGQAQGFDGVRQVAEALGGVVGATRGAVDNEWIGAAHQVGQTGKTVAPKFYLGLGVSGAVQHLVGMQGSETIVAINSDPEAAIFDVAHLGVVGDVKQIVPELLKLLENGQEP